MPIPYGTPGEFEHLNLVSAASPIDLHFDHHAEVQPPRNCHHNHDAQIDGLSDIKKTFGFGYPPETLSLQGAFANTKRLRLKIPRWPWRR